MFLLDLDSYEELRIENIPTKNEHNILPFKLFVCTSASCASEDDFRFIESNIFLAVKELVQYNHHHWMNQLTHHYLDLTH